MNYTLREIKLFYEIMQKRKEREFRELILTIRLAVWSENINEVLNDL